MKTNSSPVHLAMGIDIGGSHITVGLVDLSMKKIVRESIERKKVNRHGAAEEILGVWAAAINTMQDRYPQSFTQVGFAMPGPFDYPNGICLIKGFDKYEALYGMNIKEELAARTNIAAENIMFRNDADAFLDGEIFCGAAQGYNRVVGLTLGTGLGSCVYIDGEITDAGLNVLPYKNGIAEDCISSRWFEKRYLEYSGEKINGVKRIAEIYPEDPYAKLIFDEFTANLSAVLAHSIRTFQPSAIVLGGNISNAFDLFIDGVKKQLSLMTKPPEILRAILNEDAALIGSACWFQSLTIHAEK